MIKTKYFNSTQIWNTSKMKRKLIILYGVKIVEEVENNNNS